MSETNLSVLEICAGAGGQSFGLEQGGFEHELAVEIDKDAAATLRLNRPHWDVQEDDVRNVDGKNTAASTCSLAEYLARRLASQASS